MPEKLSGRMTLLPKGLLFLFQNALFTSITLILYQILNFTSQKEFIDLSKKCYIKARVPFDCWLYQRQTLHLLAISTVKSSVGTIEREWGQSICSKIEVQDVLWRKQRNFLNIHYDATPVKDENTLNNSINILYLYLYIYIIAV